MGGREYWGGAFSGHIDYVIGLFAAGAEGGEKGTEPNLKSKIGLRRHRSKSIYFCNGGRLGAPIPLVAR